MGKKPQEEEVQRIIVVGLVEGDCFPFFLAIDYFVFWVVLESKSSVPFH
jgi:hypothetical protein